MSIGLELLVIGTCVSGSACNEASKAYFAQSSELQATASNAQHIGEKYIGKETLSLFGTVAGIAFIKSGNVPLGNNANIQIGDINMIVLHWELK